MSRFKAVIFDLDGTLITSSIDFKLMRERVISYLLASGIPSEILSASDTVTSSLARFREFMKKTGEERALEDMEREINSLLIQVELADVARTTQMNGAKEVISDLRREGYRTGLLTRGSRTYALKALEIAGLDDRCFDVIVCRDDFPASETKPNGKAMERVARMLNLSSSTCLMLGDHPIDMYCSIAAGSTFVGVLSGWSDDRTWREKGCSYVIESVADLPAWLLEHASTDLHEGGGGQARRL